MRIRIATKNIEKINNALDEVQHGTTGYDVAYPQIVSTCENAEERLKNIIGTLNFEKAIEGIEIFYNGKRYLTGSISRTLYGTCFRCRYHKGNWYLIDINRGIYPNGYYNYPYSIMLTERCKDAILKSFE